MSQIQHHTWFSRLSPQRKKPRIHGKNHGKIPLHSRSAWGLHPHHCEDLSSTVQGFFRSENGIHPGGFLMHCSGITPQASNLWSAQKKNVQKKHHFYHFTSPNLLVSLKLGARAASTAPSSSDRWAGYQAMPALVLPPGKFKSIKKRNNKNDLRNKNRNPNIMN